MPELPEVEYTARQLRATIIGKTIAHVDVFWGRTIQYPVLADFLTSIEHRQVMGVRRRGKLVLLDLSGDMVLSIHRRMTGNFLLLPAGWGIDTTLREREPLTWDTKGPTFYEISTEKRSDEGQEGMIGVATRPIDLVQTRYCRVCFTFIGGERLLFTDLRKFGRIALYPLSKEDMMLRSVGVEPLAETFTVVQFANVLAGHGKMGIKQALLAQGLVAGIGNIYADEALFYAKIHPLRRVNTLSREEMTLLHQGIVTVLERGIEHGGTSFNDYRDLWGEAGSNYDHVLVYQKDGTPCPRCGTAIERIIVTQRGTHFCPTCQPDVEA